MKKLPLLLICLSLPALGDGLPDLGDTSQTVLTPQQERIIGQQSLLQFRSGKQYLDDPEVNDYLNRLGYRLVEYSTEPGLGFEFFAIDDANVNAFALPGGFIGVNTGLLLTAQSESELASVLGHEIAHVTQHHLARMMAGTRYDGIASIAAMAVAVLAARSNPQTSQAAIVGSQAQAIQNRLNYTRTHEEEADRIGVDLLAKSGFNTHAMPDFLNRMQTATRLFEGNAPNYLRTHPVTSNRIADIENRVQEQPYRLIADSLDFQFVRAKLIGRQKSPRDAIAYFTEALGAQKHGNPIAQRYGLVLSLLRDNETGRASEELALLRRQMEENPAEKRNAMVETLTGQVRRAAGNATDVIAFYRSAVQDFPQHRALVYDYAGLLIDAGQADKAITLLTEHLSRQPDDIRLYNLQASGYARLGKHLEEHKALAYGYYWQGRIPAAIEQLELAKRAGGSFQQLAAIDSDLKELRGLMTSQAK